MRNRDASQIEREKERRPFEKDAVKDKDGKRFENVSEIDGTSHQGHSDIVSEVIPDSGPGLASFDDDPKVGRVVIFIPDSFPDFKIQKNLFHHAFFCSLADAKTKTIQVWK